MGLLAVLHRSGVNAALLAGLLLMPALVAVGYWTDGRGAFPDLALRGCFEPDPEARPDPSAVLPGTPTAVPPR